MKQQTAVKAKKGIMPRQKNSLLRHVPVAPAAGHEFSTGSSSESFTYDFSRIPAQPLREAACRDASRSSCPMSPQRCPFGGACHSCPPQVQAKLRVGPPGDKYEKEADQVAEQVMRMPEPTVQRKGCSSCSEKEEERLVQAKSAGSAGNGRAQAMDHPQIQSVLSSPGKPLDAATRNFMEPRFGQDFSRVRVHTDRRAAESARTVNAQAYTVGRNIVFGAGAYSLGALTGRKLLAHELTHVVQQQAAGEAGLGTATTPSLSESRIQRRIGDGHDLQSPRFARDTTLQNIYDGVGTLKRGDENESVRRIQHAIHDSGLLFLGHGVDGKFGRETRNRVIRFQRRHRITTDPRGEVGAATVERLDQLFVATALPAGATGAYSFPCMLRLLCQWNSAMIRDLRRLYVWMVADLEWADERFDGTSWRPNPTPGSGETVGHTIFVATDDTCENVARTLYHEYQHARSPVVYRRGGWGDEENYAYRVETDWAIARGITPDPSLTTTNPVTGQTEVDPSGISSTVESYPGLSTASPGEVIGKLPGNRVRVRLNNGRIQVRNARAGDTVPGRRVTRTPRRRVRPREWRC